MNEIIREAIKDVAFTAEEAIMIGGLTIGIRDEEVTIIMVEVEVVMVIRITVGGIKITVAGVIIKITAETEAMGITVAEAEEDKEAITPLIIQADAIEICDLIFL